MPLSMLAPTVRNSTVAPRQHGMLGMRRRGVGVGLASLVTLPAIGAKTGGIKAFLDGMKLRILVGINGTFDGIQGDYSW